MDANYIRMMIAKLNDGAGQMTGAVSDLSNAYFDMRKDNTIGNDDYFHCVGNFNAARRGNVGGKTAEVLGDAKEVKDYYYNQIVKGYSQPKAYKDYLWDTGINKISRQRAENDLYLNHKDACNIFRVRGINEKY
jgi:hypothetical protein